MDYASCGIGSKPVDVMDCPSENCVSAPEYSWKTGVWGMVIMLDCFLDY